MDYTGVRSNLIRTLHHAFPKTHIEDIEDAVSEAIARSLTLMPPGLSEAAQLQWLRNTALHCLYREHVKVEREAHLPDELEAVASCDELVVDAKEFVQWALSKLPERTRMIMVGKILGGRPLWEVAERLSMKTTTVQTIFTRGMRTLKTVIEQQIKRGGKSVVLMMVAPASSSRPSIRSSR
jgi:RNA polymerase sigma factor (sigma-70 family)